MSPNRTPPRGRQRAAALPRIPNSRNVVAKRSGASLSRRLGLLRVVMLIGVAVLVIQLVNLEVVRSSYFQRASADQLLDTVQVPALRGTVYDRTGAVLCISVPTRQVVADDLLIKDPAVEAAALAPLVGLRERTLAPMLEEDNGNVVLTPNVSVRAAATLEADQLPGISIIDSSERSDPDGSLAETVLGGTNVGPGAAGLESQFQSLLAGQDGEERVFESPSGVTLPNAQAVIVHRPVQGTGLELTIDAPLQYVTEQALGDELAASNGLTGTAIVLDTRTGQILSMASLVNRKERDSRIPGARAWPTPTGIPGIYETQNNLAVTNMYEPGSVFKIVPFSAALADHVITPTTAFSVPDAVRIDGSLFHDAETHGVERLTATQILEYSSNIGTYEITNELGESRLLAQVQRLGFGRVSGLNFPGEASGILMDAAGWSPTDIVSLPIGQQDAVTPLQVVDAYNTIANRGVFVTPSLVRAKVDADGTLDPARRPGQRRVLPVAVANELVKMLVQVVAGGTGTEAAVPGYTIAGKTGTAQIPVAGEAKYLTGAYNATFVGFAPAQHPELTMIVMIQRPTPVIYGGDVAAPVFARVMAYALHRYGVPTSGPGRTTTTGGSSDYQDVT